MLLKQCYYGLEWEKGKENNGLRESGEGGGEVTQCGEEDVGGERDLWAPLFRDRRCLATIWRDL